MKLLKKVSTKLPEKVSLETFLLCFLRPLLSFGQSRKQPECHEVLVLCCFFSEHVKVDYAYCSEFEFENEFSCV